MTQKLLDELRVNVLEQEQGGTCVLQCRMLWVWFSYCFEGVHREVALQRPLLAAPQSYQRRQRRHACLSRGTLPSPPLKLLELYVGAVGELELAR
jgi:hypothetical protein